MSDNERIQLRLDVIGNSHDSLNKRLRLLEKSKEFSPEQLSRFVQYLFAQFDLGKNT